MYTNVRAFVYNMGTKTNDEFKLKYVWNIRPFGVVILHLRVIGCDARPPQGNRQAAVIISSE